MGFFLFRKYETRTYFLCLLDSHQTDLKTNELGNGEAYLLSGSTMSGISLIMHFA